MLQVSAIQSHYPAAFISRTLHSYIALGFFSQTLHSHIVLGLLRIDSTQLQKTYLVKLVHQRHFSIPSQHGFVRFQHLAKLIKIAFFGPQVAPNLYVHKTELVGHLKNYLIKPYMKLFEFIWTENAIFSFHQGCYWQALHSYKKVIK